MSFLHTVAAFLLAILLLVSLHELGHLLVARLFNIKVIRFSVGFGKPFFSTRWRNIEWCLAPIPLGGYVKMADTREQDVPTADLPFAFDKQHPAKRMAVVVAGPLTNLLLAVVLYAFSFQVFGVEQMRPMVGTVAKESVAARAGFQAGDTLVSVNGVAVQDWGAAQAALVLDLEAGPVRVEVRDAQGVLQQRTIAEVSGEEARAAAQRGGYIGLSPNRSTTVLGAVSPDSPAHRAGLQTGDKLVSLNAVAVQNWADVAEVVRAHPQDRLQVAYERNGVAMQTFLRPDGREGRDGVIYGFAGFAGSLDEAWAAQVNYRTHPDFGQSLTLALQRVRDYTVLTFKLFGRLLTGQASMQHLSGPLTIADYAGKTAAVGLSAYVEFLAVISISLGILNLLPIPVLDGGHLMYYAAEWIRGKPIGERIQLFGIKLGLSLMLMLMIIAFFNDINRLLG